MAKEKQETIFVPGLNRHVPVDQIANINPDIDIRDATHFVSIHHTDDIEYNEETKKFTRALSTGHASIEFIARGEVEGHFGKHPFRKGMPIDIAKIEDDSKRYRDGIDYDKVYGTSTVLTKILPVTEEQYKGSFTRVDRVKESPGMFNVVNNNCNVFVNDVIQAMGIPDINISKFYTGEELKDHGKLVATNILANHGACDTSFTVTESIHTNVADKYKVPEDRILAHHVDPLNPDVRVYTILPEGICPPKIKVDNVIPPNIRIPFLIEPPLKKQFVDILPKLYPKDYPVKFEEWPKDSEGKKIIDSNDFEAIKHWLLIYKGQLAKQKEFIDILPKLYPQWYPVKFEDWPVQTWGKLTVNDGNFKAIEANLPGYRKWLADKKELIEILPKIMPESYPVKYENWTNQYGKQLLDEGKFDVIGQSLPTYRKQLSKKEFIDILPKLYPKDYPVKFENWSKDSEGKKIIDSNDFEAIKYWLPTYQGQLAKQKEFIDILPKLYPGWYPVKFEDWPADSWGKLTVNDGNFKAIEANLPGYRKWLADKKELIEILPKLHPESYPVKYENWTNQYGKQLLDQGKFDVIGQSLPTYRKQLSKKEFIDILPKLYPKDYPVKFENWSKDSEGKKIIDSNDFEAIKYWLPTYQGQLAKQKEFIDILPKLYPGWYPVKFEDWPADSWGKLMVNDGNFKAIEANLPGYRKWLADKRELIEILPKIMPESYPVKYENWTNQYGKQLLDQGKFDVIGQSLPSYRKQLAEKLALDPYTTDPMGYITSLMKGIMNSNSLEQLKKQCKDAVRECLSKAHKQLAKFIADKAGEEKKYLEDIKAKAQAEIGAAEEKCRSKCDDRYSEYDAKVKEETKIKVANAQAAHVGHVGGCGCPSVIKNDDIVAKYQPIYDNFCKQYKEEAEKEIAEIEKKYQAMTDGKGESIKESIYAKQEGINEAIASLADEINKILKDVATSINTGGTVSIDLIGKQLEQSVTHFLQKAHGTINNVTVMSVPNIEYDNPVLNHPELVKEMANKFGSGIIDKLIDFGMQFINNQEDRELLESICNQTDNVDTMSLLMGLDTHDNIS